MSVHVRVRVYVCVLLLLFLMLFLLLLFLLLLCLPVGADSLVGVSVILSGLLVSCGSCAFPVVW